MKHTDSSSFSQVAFTHFVPCFFLGMLLLYTMDAILPKQVITHLSERMFTMLSITIATITGLLVAATTVAYHLMRNNKLKKIGARTRRPASPTTIGHAATVGFISGALDILLALHSEGIMAMTVLVLLVLAWHLRVFARRMVTMLHPGNVATWGDVSELMRIYLTMLTGFTLINATLEGAHFLTGSTPPFGFAENGDIFLNALYYTVVTMTTLGFGDIVPRTWDGKILLIIQCLVSYVMFALVIGIVTRGVASDKNENQ